MKKLTIGALALALALPLGAQAQTANRMSQEQLMQYALDNNLCNDRSVVSAEYLNDADNRVGITCGDPAGIVSDSSSGLGGLGGAGVAGIAALAGLGIVALAVGGSSSSNGT